MPQATTPDTSRRALASVTMVRGDHEMLARWISHHGALAGTREMIFKRDGQAHETPVYDGAKLGAGDRVTGPAVIEEVTTTIVIEPGWSAELDASGVYIVTLAPSEGVTAIARMIKETA